MGVVGGQSNAVEEERKLLTDIWAYEKTVWAVPSMGYAVELVAVRKSKVVYESQSYILQKW